MEWRIKGVKILARGKIEKKPRIHLRKNEKLSTIRRISLPRIRCNQLNFSRLISPVGRAIPIIGRRIVHANVDRRHADFYGIAGELERTFLYDEEALRRTVTIGKSILAVLSAYNPSIGEPPHESAAFRETTQEKYFLVE
jgi:hypothetical protein